MPTIIKVIATQYIEKGQPVVIHQGLARVALEGIQKPDAEALTDIAKGDLAVFNPDERIIKKSEGDTRRRGR